MEDSHIANDKMVQEVTVFGVFDGHGGAEVAKYVEQVFISTLITLKAFKDRSYEKALYECFLKMDEMIVSKEGSEIIKKFMQDASVESNAGCTANVILIADGQMYIANSGDSRSVLRTSQVIA